MTVCAAKHPVFVSHTKELEQMASFTSDLMYRMQCKGLHSGAKYDCLHLVLTRCTELLLKMYEEKSDIIMMNDTDNWWVRKIVWFVRNVILKDLNKTG